MPTPAGFVRDNTALAAPPLLPELRLHLANEVVALWQKTEAELALEGVPPPYWAFAWAGGQALARYILDHSDIVRGKSALDFGAGSGMVGIAAAKSGAVRVTAAELDPFAAAAIGLNAEANSAEIEIVTEDVIGTTCRWQTILVGDMCYERPLAERLTQWLRHCAKDGALVLLGDPGRSYFPRSGIEKLAIYAVPTPRELEDREIRDAGVYRLDWS